MPSTAFIEMQSDLSVQFVIYAAYQPVKRYRIVQSRLGKCKPSAQLIYEFCQAHMEELVYLAHDHLELTFFDRHKGYCF